MTRLMAVCLLVLLLVPAFLLPATANADLCDAISISVGPETLPVIQISPTTAVFTGKFRQTIRVKYFSQNNGPTSSWVFEYGTHPGSYPNIVNAVLDTLTEESGFEGDIYWTRICFTFKATVQDLEPCNNYYVRFLSRSSIWKTTPCVIVSDTNVVKFSTAGCMDRTYGSGGIGTGTGTPSSLSTLPVSAPVQMASVVVQSATIATTQVSPGQDVDIAASVINKGTVNGDAKLTLYVNGEAVESKGVTVASGQTAPVHFNVSRNEPGTYDVYVNGTPAGSFTVDMFTNNDTLVYSIIALLLLGVAGTLFFLFRKRMT